MKDVLIDITEGNNRIGYQTRSKSKPLACVKNNIQLNEKRQIKVGKRSLKSSKTTVEKITTKGQEEKKNLQTIDKSENQISRNDTKNIKQFKPLTTITEIEELESIEKDPSMLSFSEDLLDLSYTLHNSSDIGMIEGNPFYVKRLIKRRENNRSLVMKDFLSINKKLNEISFDKVIGEHYLLSVFDSTSEIEMKMFPLGKGFLENSCIRANLRFKCIDFLFTFNAAMNTSNELVHSAVGYFDRYIKNKGKDLDESKLKIVVISCWFIACKMRSRNPIRLKLVSKTAGVNYDLVKHYEFDIIKTFDGSLSFPDPLFFLKWLTLSEEREIYSIGRFLVDLSTIIYEIAAHPSLVIAAATCCLAKHIWTEMPIENSWDNHHQYLTGLSIIDLRPVMTQLSHYVHRNVLAKCTYLLATYEKIKSMVKQNKRSKRKENIKK